MTFNSIKRCFTKFQNFRQEGHRHPFTKFQNFGQDVLQSFKIFGGKGGPHAPLPVGKGGPHDPTSF